jgi:TonB family protein
LCFIVSLRRRAFTPPGLVDANGRPLDVTDVSWMDPSTLPPQPNVPAPKPMTPEEAAKAQKQAQKEPLVPQPSEVNPQVVENSRPDVEKVPEHAKYVSEYDVTVQHETRAKQVEQVSPTPGTSLISPPPNPITQTEPAPKPAPTQAATATQAPKPTPGPQTAQQESPSPLAMRTPNPAHANEQPGVPVQPGPGDLPLPGNTGTAANTPAPNAGTPHGEAGATGNGTSGTGTGGAKTMPSVASLTPSDAAVARSTGTPVNDYLPNLDEGDETLVNSRQWKYASFFNRVKRAVAEHWHPDVDYRTRDPDGSVYGIADKYTVLQVTLNPDGSLREPVAIVKTCGVDFLDDDAIDAFRMAAPFPNPPQDLVDPTTHTITFKFGFLFEIDATPGIKDIFRTE